MAPTVFKLIFRIMRLYSTSCLVLFLALFKNISATRENIGRWPDWQRKKLESIEWRGIESKFEDISKQVKDIRDKIGDNNLMFGMFISCIYSRVHPDRQHPHPDHPQPADSRPHQVGAAVPPHLRCPLHGVRGLLVQEHPHLHF